MLIDSPAGQQILDMLRYSAVGTRDVVRRYLEEFRTHAQADELMVSLQSPSTAVMKSAGGGRRLDDVGQAVLSRTGAQKRQPRTPTISKLGRTCENLYFCYTFLNLYYSIGPFVNPCTSTSTMSPLGIIEVTTYCFNRIRFPLDHNLNSELNK